MRPILFLFFASALVTAALLAVTASGDSCPDQGTQFVDMQIKDIGSQRCPRFVIGPGIPGLGQMRIVGFGSFSCPTSQQKIEPHFKVVPKQGFRVVADGEYKIWEREVTCSSSENLLVIGFPDCETGEWKVVSTKRDYDEIPCTLPPN